MACTPGHVLERPGKGVHSRAFTRKHGADNWESQNALTICLPPGTTAAAAGTGRILVTGFGPWRVQGARQGSRCHLQLVTGEILFYGYLARLLVKANDKVTIGDPIGITGYVRGRGALHFAAKPPASPWNFYGDAWLPVGAAAPGPGGPSPLDPIAVNTPGTPAENSALPQRIEDAWTDFEFALRVTLPHQASNVDDARQALHKTVFS